MGRQWQYKQIGLRHLFTMPIVRIGRPSYANFRSSNCFKVIVLYELSLRLSREHYAGTSE